MYSRVYSQKNVFTYRSHPMRQQSCSIHVAALSPTATPNCLRC